MLMASRIIIHIMLYIILYVDIDIYIGTKAFSENWFQKLIVNLQKIF